MNGNNGGVSTVLPVVENILKDPYGMGGSHYVDKIDTILKPKEWDADTPAKPTLTPEQERKLERYDRLKFEDLPDNWEEEHQKLLENQEKHSEVDLKPTDLPDNWKTKLDNISELEKRPNITKEQWENDYKNRPIKGDYDNLKTKLIKANNALNTLLQWEKEK